MNNHTRVADLTVEELLTLVRSAIREELKREYPEHTISQTAILEFQPLHVGQWPTGLKLFSREEFYDDER